MTAPPLEIADSKDEKLKQATKPKSAPVDDGHSHEVSGDTITAAIFGIVKAMVGPAILYLPHSFADAGYAFAIVALWICTAMYLYTSQRLLSTWRYVKSQQAHKQKDKRGQTEIEMTSLVLDENPKRITKRRTKNTEEENGESDDQGSMMDDIGEVVIYDMDQEQPVGNSISYPQLARIAYGEVGENTVRAGITLMQLGVCLTYFIFVPHNLSASILMLTNVRLPLWLCLVGMVIIEIPMSSIRNVSKLVTTNVIATCLIAFGLASCLFIAIFHDTDGQNTVELGNVESDDKFYYKPSDDLWIEDIAKTSHMSPWNDHWYLFIGTSVLLFEGSITLCIPLQEALQVPDAETTFPVVYNQTISSIVLFYTVFGFLCWRAFGDDVSTVLTTSLPEGALATTVQLAYSIAVILTFPLQIFPALEIIVHQVELRLQGESEIVVQLSPWQRRMVCTVVIVLLSIIAVVEMDNLGKVVALMGSLLGCPLAFVFPPLIHSKIIPNAPTKLDWAVSGAGILAMIGATLITLATWSEPGERRRLDVSSIFGLG